MRLAGAAGLRLAVLAAALAAGGCELPSWLGESEPPALPGERISVLSLDQQLEPDPRIADVSVQLPRPWTNVDWPQVGGHPTHAMYHLTLGDTLQQIWRRDIGAGSGRATRLLTQPVTRDGRLFAMDAESTVTALDVRGGAELWTTSLVPEEEEEGAVGGGLATGGNRLFVSTPYGFVHALDPANGREIWNRRIGVPMRGAPTYADGRVFVVSYDNQVHALDAGTGQVAWQHAGIPEDAGLIGSSSPAVTGTTVIAALSSGEVLALRTDNGRVLWSDQLVRQGRLTPLAQLADIRGLPVIDRDRVFAVSHSGRMAAIDLSTGERIWDRDVASIETPWVAGEFVYLVTNTAEVVCLSRRDGRVRWVRPLQEREDPDDRNSLPVIWSGPVLAGDRLIAVSSTAEAVAISPYTGEVLGRLELPDPVYVAPVVAGDTLYIVTDDAELIALR